jgi:hypothetical protein
MVHMVVPVRRSGWTWLRRVALLPVVAGLLIATAWGVLSRDLPELQAWHTDGPRGEVTAADMNDRFTLADFLRREDQAMRDVRERIEARTPEALRTRANRYFSDSPLNPRHLPTDWNRTFELVPETIRGGALLVHGMSDGPYSIRAMAGRTRAGGLARLGCRRSHGSAACSSADR